MESHTLAASVSQVSAGGVMVSIVAFQAIDPGSIAANAVFFVLNPGLPRSIRAGLGSIPGHCSFSFLFLFIQVKVQLVVILCMLDWT